MLQTHLAKGASIVDQELTDAKRALATFEVATRVEWERLTAEIVGEFRRQEAQQKQDAESAKDRDSILEHEVLNLKKHVKAQDATWQQVLHNHEERGEQLLK